VGEGGPNGGVVEQEVLPHRTGFAKGNEAFAGTDTGSAQGKRGKGFSSGTFGWRLEEQELKGFVHGHRFVARIKGEEEEARQKQVRNAERRCVDRGFFRSRLVGTLTVALPRE